ncbi:MAG: ABC transporter ATP-binding protein [Kiloniellales bacterium]|nr:ABC transporter ATP-binding protein [Kiloniellales bacterium]MDJ0980387.1 ABC transporter ATP-binding protein [Kiloniellales bacterium]
MRAPDAMVALDAVSKRYGRKEVLHEVSLSVERGECLALVGHNGAGKTTLFKLMLGLTRASAGRILIEGEDPAGRAAVARRAAIGVLPESVAFHNAMTGREVLAFYARLKGQSPRVCDELLARFGLAEAARQRVGTYSKGMRQRLGLAQAVIGAPRLLLFDEPTSGLDPAFRQSFYELLSRQRDAGTTAIISSHALTEIEARADRVAIMNHGRLVACGSLEALRDAAKLRTRLRISVASGETGRLAEGLGAFAEIERIDERTLELICPAKDKMELLRRITALGPSVEDVDIRPPTLEEIYRTFATGEGS